MRNCWWTLAGTQGIQNAARSSPWYTTLAKRIDNPKGLERDLTMRTESGLVAVAFALVYGPLTGAATAGLEDDAHGAAGGVVFTAFQFGGALGLAAVTILLVSGTGAAAALVDYRSALLVPTLLAASATVVGVVAVARRGKAARSV